MDVLPRVSLLRARRLESYVWRMCEAEGDQPLPFEHPIRSPSLNQPCHAHPSPTPNPHFPTGWLKEQRDASRPAVNMRGEYTAKYRARHGHHHAPPRVAWVSGVPVSKLRGRPMTNGTWSGRAVW